MHQKQSLLMHHNWTFPRYNSNDSRLQTNTFCREQPKTAAVIGFELLYLVPPLSLACPDF